MSSIRLQVKVHFLKSLDRFRVPELIITRSTTSLGLTVNQMCYWCITEITSQKYKEL